MTAETRAPRPMRADARRNYEKLVAVATESFLANGPDASLDDIAKRAGVGPGTLYRHFPNREALLDAVCVQWADSVAADAAPLLTAEDPTAALQDWLVQLVGHVGAFKGLASALLLSVDRKHQTACVLHDTSDVLVERAKAVGGIRADVTTSELMQLTSGVTYACGYSKQAGKPVSTPERLIGLIMDGVRTD